ncbi:single-stranded DNA-binding protein [Actinoalloteichus hymeniacidonis]|uniref:Single-strand binding protein n=1 Tax=Actinoalloteichus hymeniacidonis TaxID=340345 RepID=A0AAC9HN24_9PSEU|nr:single-stranded DNA-binding protein [Actinoalloteichus hymeniacidonis]AOS62382.1 single-strand binding protein [Actinoalloteichus hymeniacidonis]MBB5909588.1 single-strand DNA-binding protein [Actinoalloteichus hymeniacidonis]
MNETSTTITGVVISELRFRRSAEGTPTTTFRLGSIERRYDRRNGQWVTGDRLFVIVRCFRLLAQRVLALLRRGDPVIVHGRLRSRDFDSGGQRLRRTELTASAIGPDLARCRASLERPSRSDLARAPTGGGDLVGDLGERTDTEYGGSTPAPAVNLVAVP